MIPAERRIAKATIASYVSRVSSDSFDGLAAASADAAICHALRLCSPRATRPSFGFFMSSLYAFFFLTQALALGLKWVYTLSTVARPHGGRWVVTR